MRKLSLLLVDDNASFLQAARRLIAMLPSVGRIECASSATDALKQLEHYQPELVLTDIVMPDMSGFELIRRLCTRDTPPRVLALSLHEGAEYRAAAMRSGALELIPKHELAKRVPELFAAIASAPEAA
jgi:DNA-binding NarL/FixJ family response regulator